MKIIGCQKSYNFQDDVQDVKKGQCQNTGDQIKKGGVKPPCPLYISFALETFKKIRWLPHFLLISPFLPTFNEKCQIFMIPTMSPFLWNFFFSNRSRRFNLFCANIPIYLILSSTLHEKCLYLEFFWSVFPRIRTEYGEILRMQKNTNQKNSEYGVFSRCDNLHQKHWNK